MAIKISGSCSMAVIGLDMNCPLCKTLVRSGEAHQCKIVPPKALPNKSRKRVESVGRSRREEGKLD